jgi:hypothetical protein
VYPGGQTYWAIASLAMPATRVATANIASLIVIIASQEICNYAAV